MVLGRYARLARSCLRWAGGLRLTTHQNHPPHGSEANGAPAATAAESLVVRQHERLSCALRADIAVDPRHAEALDIARHVADGAGRVSATCTDVSRGGMGLRSAVYFPKHAVLRVRLPDTDGCWEATVRVERATMIDRGPTYDLGVSAVQPAEPGSADTGDQPAGRLDRLLELVRRPGAGSPRPASEGTCRA